MSFITNLIAQQRAVSARISGNAMAFAGRDQLLGTANKPVGNLKQLQRDEVHFSGQIHTGNLTAKYAAAWEESARKKAREEMEKGLSGFSTFA